MKFLFLLLLLSGCSTTNKFQIYYRNLTEVPAMALAQNISPELLETIDLPNKLKLYQAKGYRVLGSSSFDGGWESRIKAIEFAKTIGATLIITTAKFTRNIAGVDYVHIPTINSSQQSGEIDLGFGTIAVFSANTTTHSTQQIATAYNIGQFEQQAFFLANDTLLTNDVLLLKDTLNSRGETNNDQ